MLTWILVTVTAVAATGVLALLVLREPLERPRPAPPVTGPADVHRRFRVVWPGYDRTEVDAHLAAIEHAWGGATSERGERDDRGGGRDRSGEELEDGGGDGAGGLDR